MKKTSEAFCKAQLKRFGGFAFAAGLSSEAWAELARVLFEEARDDGHAKRIVDEFLRTPRTNSDGDLITSVPTPIELRIFARRVLNTPDAQLPDACAECAPYAGRHRIVRHSNGYEGAGRCLCARGDALKAMDAARMGGLTKEPRREGLTPIGGAA